MHDYMRDFMINFSLIFLNLYKSYRMTKKDSKKLRETEKRQAAYALS